MVPGRPPPRVRLAETVRAAAARGKGTYRGAARPAIGIDAQAWTSARPGKEARRVEPGGSRGDARAGHRARTKRATDSDRAMVV